MARYVIQPGKLIPIAMDIFGYLHDVAYRFFRKYVNDDGAILRKLLENINFAIRNHNGDTLYKYAKSPKLNHLIYQSSRLELLLILLNIE